MNNKDKNAIEDLKKFLKKDEQKLNESSNTPKINDDFINAVGVFSSLQKVFGTFAGQLEEQKKEYIEQLVENVLVRIPKTEIPSMDEISEYVITKIPKTEVPTMERIFEYVEDKLPKKHIHTVREIQDLVNKLIKKSELLVEQKNEDIVSNLVNELKKDAQFLKKIKGEKGEKGQSGYGAPGGGLGYNDVVKTAKEEAQFGTYTNTDSGLSATRIKDAIDEVAAATGVGATSAEYNQILLTPTYTSGTNPPYVEGLGFYDYDNKTWAIYGNQPDVTLQIGQETHIRVCNHTGSTLENGTAVEIVSATNGIPCIQKSIAAIGNASSFTGLTTHDIPTGTSGLVTINGTVGSVNTSAFGVGDVLYLSDNVSGGLQNTKPISPHPVIIVGNVLESDTTNGKILIKTIDTIPLETPFEKVLYVSTSGTDSSAVDGTELKPYKTIKYTLDTITDNSSDIRYVVLVGPGLFNEVNPLMTKEYVTIKAIGGNTTTRVVATVPDEVLFYGEPRSSLTDIALQNTSGYCFEMSATFNTDLENIAFTNSKNWIKVSNPTADVTLRNPSFITSPFGGTGTDLGINIESGVLKMYTCVITSVVSATTLFRTSGSDSKLEIRTLDCDSGDVTNIFEIYDNSETDVKLFDIRNVDNVVSLDTSAVGHFFSGYVKDCNNGFIIDGDTTKAELFGVDCDDCVVDISATSGTVIRGGGNSFRNDRTFLDDSDAVLAHISETPGDEGFLIKGELHVGSPEQPKESVFGEGDSYNQDVYTYVYEASANTWEDVSVSASSYTDSVFRTPLSSGSAIYLASKKTKSGKEIQHNGFKINIDKPAHISATDIYDVVITGGTSADGNYVFAGLFDDTPYFRRTDTGFWLFLSRNIWCLNNLDPDTESRSRFCAYISETGIEGLYVAQNGFTGTPVVDVTAEDQEPFIVTEYWDGATSAWTEFNTMATEGQGKYIPIQEKLLLLGGVYQVRYDVRLKEEYDWELNDPIDTGLGTDYYWVRFRWNQDIADSAEIQQVKLHTNRTEINSDGYLEYFGKARPYRKLPWDAGLLEAAAASPGNQDLFLSDNIDVGRRENEFANGATDRIGFLSPIPFDCDTSSPIRLQWSIRTDDNTLGDIGWVIRWGYSSPGGNVYGSQATAPTTAPNEQSISFSEVAPAQDVEKWFSQDLDISSMISRRIDGYPDTLWVSLERPSGDTHAGDVSLIAIAAYYSSWCTGGHI